MASKEKIDNQQRKLPREENEVRDVEIFRALTALNPWRSSEQNQPDVETKASNTFRFVKGLPDQKWMKDGKPPFIQDNSFWRALALAHGGTQDLWPIYKYQAFDYLTKVLDEKNTNLQRTHPRAVLYTVLNGHAGGRTDEHLKRKPADLVTQTQESDAPVSSEIFQVIADLYSIELLVIFLRDYATSDKPHGIVSRGQHNHRQIFLTCYTSPETASASSGQAKKFFYQAVLPAVAEPWDFKFTAHMDGDKARVNIRRCPFVFNAGTALEKTMPGIPEGTARVPPPPIFPPPTPITATKETLQAHFKTYTGPIGDGTKGIPEPLTVISIGRKSSVKVSGGESSSSKKVARPPSASIITPPALRVGADKTKSSSSVGHNSDKGKDVSRPLIIGKTSSSTGRPRRASSTSGTASSLAKVIGPGGSRSGSSVGHHADKEVSRPPISEKTSTSGRSRRTSSTGDTASSLAKVVSPRGNRSGSSVGHNADKEVSRPPISGRNPTTGRSRTPSIGASSTAPKKIPPIAQPRKNSTSGKAPSTDKVRKPSIGTTRNPIPVSASPSTTKPSAVGEKTVLPNRTRKTSVSYIPAPPSSTRRNSFSRPEVICRIRTPSPPRDDPAMPVPETKTLGGKPVIDPEKPPPVWANKNIIGYGKVPESMKDGKK